MAMVFEKMERARHRKSRSTSAPEGPPQIQKHKPAVSRLSSNSRAYIDDNIKDNMFTLDSGLSSSRRATRTPMYEKIVSKRLSSSVTSRLGVLERLPSLWRVHRRRNLLPDNYKHKNVPIDIQAERRLYDGHSNRRRSPTREQQFKDVHEDLEASCYDNPRCSSRWSASSMLTKSDMASIYESEDLLMEFDGQQGYSIMNRSRDRRVDPSRSSRSSHTSVLKTSISIDYKGNAKAWKSERDSTGEHDMTCQPEWEDALMLEPHVRHRAHSYRKSSVVQLEEKNDKSMLPKKIVVLKPSLGVSGSSTYRSNIGDAEEIFSRWKGSSYNLGFSNPVPSEARKIAREITRRMRGGCDANETMDAWFRGYAGDQNSYDAHGSDSDTESEMFKLSSRISSGYGNHQGIYPSSSSVDWSVNREAKKRLRERWRITQRYQELEIVSKGSTLGEMLAIRDGETRYTSCANTSLVRASNRLDINNGSGEFLKDKSRRTSSSRSRSLPPSAGGRVAKGKLCRKETFSSQDSKCRSQKPLHCHHLYTNEIDTTLCEADFEIRMEPNIKNSSQQNLTIQMAGKEDNIHDQKEFRLQELQKGSNSKSFEEVSAALNAELRMQLQLLKTESVPTYADQIPALVPIEQSPNHPEGYYYKSSGADEGWEVSYALDVLIHSGLYEFGLDILRMMTWHSPYCPLGPTLFDELEKKYSDHEMIGLRPERRLLFDSINSALLEIFQQHVDFCPWVMPKLRGSKQKEGELKDALEKVIINQESVNVQQVPEMILEDETQWRDSNIEIDLIGTDIEGFLMEDLIIEFFRS